MGFHEILHRIHDREGQVVACLNEAWFPQKVACVIANGEFNTFHIPESRPMVTKAA
jgi:hypothetical protein